MFSTKEKLLLFVLAFVQFSHIVDFMIIMPLGPQLMRVFAILPQQFSYLVSSYSLAAGVTSFCSAFFVDRFDRRNSLLFFYAGFGLCTGACSFAGDYLTLLLTRTLAGAFGGVIFSIALSIVGDAIDHKRRATAVGILMTAYSIASIFGVPFSLYLAQNLSWQSPFIFLGGLSGFLFLAIVRWIPKSNMNLRQQLEVTGRARVMGIFKNSSQIMSLVFITCLVLSQFSIVPFLSIAMIYNAGLPESKLGLIYLVSGISTIIFAPLVGKWADTYGKRRLFYLSTLASLLPILIITRLGQTSTWIVLLIVMFFFVTMTGRMIPAMAMANSTVTPQNRGSFMSVGSSAQQFASAAASMLTGMIVVQSPSGALLNYPTVGIVALGFSLLAMAAAARIVSVDGKI
jgi:DHA1 family inner membrane transport protein